MKELANKFYWNTAMLILFFFFLKYCPCPLQATIAGSSNCDRDCIFPKLRYLLSGPFQKKFAQPWLRVSAVRSVITPECGKGKVNDNWRCVGGEPLAVVGKMNASPSFISTHPGKLVENRFRVFYPCRLVFETSQNIII